MKKILISGATGFLGSYLVKEFNEKGFYVKATGRNVKKGEKIQNKNVEFIQCDIQNEDECIEKFKDIDYVIHAAALSNPWGDYDEFYRTNVVGTSALYQSGLFCNGINCSSYGISFARNMSHTRSQNGHHPFVSL